MKLPPRNVTLLLSLLPPSLSLTLAPPTPLPLSPITPQAANLTPPIIPAAIAANPSSPISCLVPSPILLSTQHCALAVGNIRRSPHFHDHQIFTPSPDAFTGGSRTGKPRLPPEFLPYTWHSWDAPPPPPRFRGGGADGGSGSGSRAGRPEPNRCSVTLTFMDWHSGFENLMDGATLEEVQRAARRVVERCGIRYRGRETGAMTVGMTRVGVRSRLLVVVGDAG